MKKIMMLGGNYFQMTAIKAAKRCGYYVISVDYLPNNPGHKYADEYYNISTLDKEAVLKLAIDKKIDGIVSYASDVSAPTAAYVAEKMGLFTNPLKSVEILTNKSLFRNFLEKEKFPSPKSKSFSLDQIEEAKTFAFNVGYPVMVKPIDSSGSKGVYKIESADAFKNIWEKSLEYARNGILIIEKYIEREGYQIDGDIFVVNGKIVFWGICNQHHDESIAPFTPIGLSYPPVQDLKIQNKARTMVQKIITDLGILGGGLNLEYHYDNKGNVYILELAPRNGGNLIPDVVKASTGVDMAELTVKMSVGDDIQVDASEGVKCVSSFIWHSRKNGEFRDIVVDETLRKRILLSDVFVKPGDYVEKFENGGHGIGMALIGFSDSDEMLEIMDNINKHYCVNVE